MSAYEHKTDTSLGNLPERNDSQLQTTAISTNSTNIIDNNNQNKQQSIEKDTDKITKQQKSPIDKHGDTWGGGIPAQHHQFK